MPSVTYVCVDRKVSQKFFTAVNGRVSNPQYGTVINHTVTSKNYDFYMVAQNCNKGTATPTYYKVIYNTSKSKGLLQELFYSQCFNYMNWSGSV
jgi:aubergine-like protein